MPEKDPNSYELITYIWVVVLSAWAGVANYIRRVREGKNSHFSLGELVGDIVISGFVGVITFFMCESANINQTMTAAIVGISAHMGSRAIMTLECWLKKKLDQKIGSENQ